MIGSQAVEARQQYGAKEAVVAQPLVEGVTSDISYVVKELTELTACVRVFADSLLGSRPTPLSAGESKAPSAPPRRGDQLLTTLQHLKDVQRELADEIARLSGI